MTLGCKTSKLAVGISRTQAKAAGNVRRCVLPLGGQKGFNLLLTSSWLSIVIEQRPQKLLQMLHILLMPAMGIPLSMHRPELLYSLWAAEQQISAGGDSQGTLQTRTWLEPCTESQL